MIPAKEMLKNLGGTISKNSPHILTGLGCAGVLTTAILSGKAGIEAYKILDAEERAVDKKEAVKLTWTLFIPPAVVGASSIACIIGANTINVKRNAALAALYSLSETAFREYKAKVVQEIGKTKETKIRDEIAKDVVTANPPGDRTIIITGNGEVLCYDRLCDRYFKSSPEKIRQQVLELNYDLMTEMWIDLNDLYYAIGLPSTKLGNMMGFDIDKGRIEIDYSSQLTPEGQPCLVIDTTVYPKYRG